MNKQFLFCISLLMLHHHATEIREIAAFAESSEHILLKNESCACEESKEKFYTAKQSVEKCESIIDAATIIAPQSITVPQEKSHSVTITATIEESDRPTIQSIVNTADSKQQAHKKSSTYRTKSAKNSTALLQSTVSVQQQSQETVELIQEESCSLANNGINTPSLKTTRTLSLINNINKDMITYKKHWSGHHSPSAFHIKINGIELSNVLLENPNQKDLESSTAEITIENELDIEWYCNFTVMGVTYHEETKRYSCTVPQTARTLAARFSWDVDSRIIIDAIEADKRSELTIVEIV